jgi:signal transduction histidine kinase
MKTVLISHRIWYRALACFVVVWAFCGVALASPKRILILDSFGRDVAPFNVAVSAFRTTIARELGEPVDIYEASLDKARFAEPEKDGPFIEFLRSRFETRPVDLVVPIGAPAVRFVAQHRDQLFPGTPIVYTGTDPRMFPPGLLQTNATAVTQKVKIAGIIEDILQVRPDTTNIVVVLGNSPLERFWVGECQREFQAFTNRVGFTWYNELSLEQMCERSAALPPHSFILYAMLVLDAAKVPYDNDAGLQRLHAVANAPIFAYFESQFGGAAIGGRLYHDSEVGVQAAHAAVRVLHGERPENVPPVFLETGHPIYDWRELRRWGIHEDRLPAGSEVRFRQPSTWDNHKWEICGSLGLIVFEALLISALVVQLRRRRRAEVQAHRQQEELAHISRVSTLGELATSVAHELNQPLGAILSNAEAAELFLKQDPPPLGEVQAILADIRKDDERAGEVIRRMRALLKKQTLESRPLEVSSVAAEVLRLVGPKAAANKTEIVSEFSPDLPLVLGDRIQLQQVLLNLILNAMDALATRPPENRRIVVRTNHNGNGAVELSVQDSGPGIDPASLPRLFESFFTTKPTGIGMGLTICRRIVEAHHGQVWAENNPGGGAIFRVSLPVALELAAS